jgi:hypothetical protein
MMDFDSFNAFSKSIKASPAYNDNPTVRATAEIILGEIWRLPQEKLSPEEEKQELLRLMEIFHQQLERILTPGKTSELLLQEAREMMGEGKFFGAGSLLKEFGIKIDRDELPLLPLRREVERHAALGHTLRLRWDKAPDGSPLTMKKMKELLKLKMKVENLHGASYSRDWMEEESFFMRETPKRGWAFTTNDFLSDSINKDYLRQTNLLDDYLHGLFRGDPPPKIGQAILEFRSQQAGIVRLMDNGEWTMASGAIANLAINSLRPKAVDAVFDIVQTGIKSRATPGTHSAMGSYTSTRDMTFHGDFISIAEGDTYDIHVRITPVADWGPGLGVKLSREFPV